MGTVILLLLFLAVKQVDASTTTQLLRGSTYLSSLRSPTTTVSPRECIYGQCVGNQTCVEGTCQCQYVDHFYNARWDVCYPRKSQGQSCTDLPMECNTTLTCVRGKCQCNKPTEFYFQDKKLCLERKAMNESCQGYQNECVDQLTCINGRCACGPNSGFYDPNTQSCRQNFFSHAEVRLLNTPLPVVKGEQVKMLCRIAKMDLSVFEGSEVKWYFNSRKIDTDSTQMFNSTVRFRSRKEHTVLSVLTIYRFRRSLIGTYTCKIRLRGQRNNTEVGNVSITRDMFAVPEVYLEPPYLYVEEHSSVTLYCHARQIDYIMYTGEGFTSEMNEVFRSQDKFSIDTFSFVPQETSHVRCVGQLARDGHNAKVTSNKVVIKFLSKGDVTCPESEDRRGIKWTIAEASSVIHGDCPKGYNGHSTRECSAKGKWKKTNFTNCLRKDLEEIGQEVEMLEGIDPSEETIENITSKLSRSMSGDESMLFSDVSQTVDILANVSDTLSKDESDKSLVSTTSLENIADVTDQLLSTDQNEWENVEQTTETVNETRKANRMGAKLLMAMDRLAVASLKELKMSTRPIIKKNIVIKRNQADPDTDIYFPDKSDTTFKDLDDWMNGSQNVIFLPSVALPVSAEKIRYSVLMYKGIRQRMSSQDKPLEDKEVQSNIVAFSLTKKMKGLNSGLELTFGVPNDNFSEPVCGFLDTSASELGIWSTEGCKTQQLKSGLVKCTCNHLTNFAVLMSPTRLSNSTHQEVLGIISICGCTISIISLTALIFIYAFLWRFMKKDRKTYLHLALSISLLVVYVIFLAGVERSSHEPDCIITTAFLHYFLLVTFCIMLCEGVEIMMAVLYVFPSSFPAWKLLVPACVAPVPIVGLTLAITQGKDYHSDDLCWLSLSNGTLWAFVAPALAVILVNFFVLCITLRILLGSTAMKEKDNPCKTKMALKSFAILSPVLGLTWFFGILSINSYTIVFQYLFAICNTLQGFAIFFFYCLSFYQVKDAFKVMRRKQRGGQSESDTPSSNKSRIRSGLNIFRRKQKGKYNVENSAFLSPQPKSSSEGTDQREPASTSNYEVNPAETTSSQITFTNDVYRTPSTVTEQESVFTAEVQI